jgi:hypothetical protein
MRRGSVRDHHQVATFVVAKHVPQEIDHLA